MSNENEIEIAAPERDRLCEELNALEYDEAGHAEPWKNEVAKELNELLGRATWWTETDGDDIDFVFAKATLSICRRVAEFEDVRTKPLNEKLSV